MREFKESQRFDQWWMKLLLLITIGFMLYAIYQWYILGENVGNIASTDWASQLIAFLSLLITMGFIFSIRLYTTIDSVGIHYRFKPFHLKKKTIQWSAMNNCYVRLYRPILEYGGWGYRTSLKNGKAYNIKGNQGIQIELKSGKKILIGTQKEIEASNVLHKLHRKQI